MGGGISKDNIRHQIRGKLRNDYHGVRNNNDYVLSIDWSKIRGTRQ
jgi:hypothetical protein